MKASFIKPSNSGHMKEYEFSHDLLHKSVHALLLYSQRRDIHKALAVLLEKENKHANAEYKKHKKVIMILK